MKNIHVNRRRFLKRAGVAAGSLALPYPLASNAQSIAENVTGVVVVVFLRGGCDGIHMLPPDPVNSADDYDFLYGQYAGENVVDSPIKDPKRKEIAFTGTDNDKVIRSAGPLALHSALLPLLSVWEQKNLTFFPATHVGGVNIFEDSGGVVTPGSFSHFTGQAIIEDGGYGESRKLPKMSSERGWIARALDSDDINSISAVSLGGNAAFAGDTGFLKVSNLSNGMVISRVVAPYGVADKLKDYLEASVDSCAAGVIPCEALAAQLNTVMKADRLKTVWEDYTRDETNKASYPSANSSFRQAAALIKGIDELKVVTLDIGGFDHHVNMQPRIERGLATVADSMAAFHRDMHGVGRRVQVVVLTEFGRTVGLNSSGGTDHGQASTAIVMNCGGSDTAPISPNKLNIAYGGKNSGGYRWPGYKALIPDTGKYSDYLSPITDYRDILCGVMSRTLGIQIESVFNDIDESYALDKRFDETW